MSNVDGAGQITQFNQGNFLYERIVKILQVAPYALLCACHWPDRPLAAKPRKKPSRPFNLCDNLEIMVGPTSTIREGALPLKKPLATKLKPTYWENVRKVLTRKRTNSKRLAGEGVDMIFYDFIRVFSEPDCEVSLQKFPDIHFEHATGISGGRQCFQTYSSPL